MATTTLFPYVLIPFPPHMIETSVDGYLVLIVSPSLSFGFLDLEKCVPVLVSCDLPPAVSLSQLTPLPAASLVGLPVAVY